MLLSLLMVTIMKFIEFSLISVFSSLLLSSCWPLFKVFKELPLLNLFFFTKISNCYELKCGNMKSDFLLALKAKINVFWNKDREWEMNIFWRKFSPFLIPLRPSHHLLKRNFQSSKNFDFSFWGKQCTFLPNYSFTSCLLKFILFFNHISGFIIDAFGALRDQMQGVEDELENNCFICGIGKDYLDSVPHGFDIHVQKEHNLANYLWVNFFLTFTKKISIFKINWYYKIHPKGPR